METIFLGDVEVAMTSVGKAVSVLTVGVLIALSGCTSAPSRDAGKPTGPAAPSSAATTEARTNDAPQSAASLWTHNSDRAPIGFTPRDVVLDVTGTGPGDINVPDLRAYTAVRLALRCASPQAYELTLVGSVPTEGIVSGGTDCVVSTGGVNSYLTPALPASIRNNPSVVQVHTTPGVAFALSIIGVRT